MPTQVGIFVRVAGVWERQTGGTPIGFGGVNIKVSGDWEPLVVGYTYTSVWQATWTNIDGDLNLPGGSSDDFDISPYNVTSGFRFFGSGKIQRDNNGNGFQDWGTWWYYANGRDYEIWFEYDSGHHISNEPTLNTWLNFTDPETNHWLYDSESGSGFLFTTGYYTVRVREKVSAPAGGNDLGVYDISLTAEV